MVNDLALGKNGDLLEIVVVLDDLVEVDVAFTTNVLKCLDLKAGLGHILGAGVWESSQSSVMRGEAVLSAVGARFWFGREKRW